MREAVMSRGAKCWGEEWREATGVHEAAALDAVPREAPLSPAAGMWGEDSLRRWGKRQGQRPRLEAGGQAPGTAGARRREPAVRAWV